MTARPPLARWFESLAAADERPSLVTVIGDSITAGANASGGGRRGGVGRRPSRRYADLLALGLNAGLDGPPPDPEPSWTGGGWFEVERRTQQLRFGWDRASGHPEACGLGGHGWRLGAGHAVEHRALCDGVDLYFTAAVGGTPLEVLIDGEPVVSLPTAGPRVRSGRRWASSALPLAWHEVRVRGNDPSATARLDGGYFHRGTRSRGVLVHVGGHNGWSTLDAARHRGTFDHLAGNPPDLVVWATGTNDHAAGPNELEASLAEAMERVARTCPRADRALVFPYALPGRTTWDRFQDAAARVASTTGTALVDLHAHLGGAPPTPESAFLSPDGVHPGDVGHAVIADAILAVIRPSAT